MKLNIKSCFCEIGNLFSIWFRVNEIATNSNIGSSTTSINQLIKKKWFFSLFIVICNCILFLTGVMCIWCSYDVAGRSWVKLKNYQKSQQSAKKIQFKRSGGNLNRSWRHRLVALARSSKIRSLCLNKFTHHSLPLLFT